jgi:hypothetical protein
MDTWMEERINKMSGHYSSLKFPAQKSWEYTGTNRYRQRLPQ